MEERANRACRSKENVSVGKRHGRGRSSGWPIYSDASVPAPEPISRKSHQTQGSVITIFCEVDTDHERNIDSSYFRPRNAEEPSQGVDGERWQTPSPSKRTRKVSPIAIRRDLEGKRTEREKRKQEKWEKRLDERRRERDRRLMEDVFTEIPEFGGYTNGMFSHNLFPNYLRRNDRND